VTDVIICKSLRYLIIIKYKQFIISQTGCGLSQIRDGFKQNMNLITGATCLIEHAAMSQPQAVTIRNYGKGKHATLTFWLRDASTSLTFNNCTFCPHCIYVLCKQRLVPITA
jgi:hypothetical protein